MMVCDFCNKDDRKLTAENVIIVAAPNNYSAICESCAVEALEAAKWHRNNLMAAPARNERE